jgi:hypothetical protein
MAAPSSCALLGHTDLLCSDSEDECESVSRSLVVAPSYMYSSFGYPNELAICVNLSFGISDQVEPLAYLKDTYAENFLFTTDGRYYEYADYKIYRFERPFASHDEFLLSIKPLHERRAEATQLQRLTIQTIINSTSTSSTTALTRRTRTIQTRLGANCRDLQGDGMHAGT